MKAAFHRYIFRILLIVPQLMLSCHHEIIKKNSANVRKHVFLFLVSRDVKNVLQDLSIWVPLQDNEQFQQRTQDRVQVIYTR